MPRKPQPRREKITRYHTPDGKRCLKDTPGAVRSFDWSPYCYRYTDDKGEKVTVNLGHELSEAHAQLRDFLRQRDRRRLGVEDQFTDAAQRPLSELIEEWLASIHGRTPQYLAELRSQITRLVAIARWRRVTDIAAGTCRAAINQLAKGGGDTSRPVSAATRNHYLGTVKMFVGWCLSEPAKLQRNPLAGLKGSSVRADRRHLRRCPTSQEIETLLSHLAKDDHVGRRGWSAAQRAAAYKLAIGTGLRASEVRSLTVESFDWKARTVTVAAAYSKHRKTDTVPLPKWLTTDLKAYFAAGGADWRAARKHDLGKMLRRDLKRAGIPYVVTSPRGPEVFDFHCLRIWYITAVAAQPGIDPKTLMELARHSTARLSLEIYAKARQGAVREAAEQIPEPEKKGRKR